MYSENLTFALLDIHEYKQAVAAAQEHLDGYNPNGPITSSVIFTPDEVGLAMNIEAEQNEAMQQLEKAQNTLRKAEEKFFNLLPASVLKQMREAGKAVYFSHEDEYQQGYGPYVAYFENDALVVTLYDNPRDFEAFKESFIYRRTK